MQCPKCNWKNQENAHFCANCAHQLIKSPGFHKRHPVWTVVGSLFILICLLVIYEIGHLFNQAVADINQQSSQESIIEGSGDDTIALINIDGEIVETDQTDGFSSFSNTTTSARHIKKVLQEVADDSSVKAILLRINSPGGSAAASDEILSDVKNFKEEHHIPIIAYFSDLAASGGYYVSLSADKIIANPSSITGSIGVILSYLNYGDLAQNYGVHSVVFKSGEHKDLVSPFRDPTKDESEILQSVVDDAYNVFLENVVSGRKLEKEKAKTLADGRIYSAKQAKEKGLVDSLGNFSDAVLETRKLAHIEEAKVVEFGKQGFFESLFESYLPHFNQSIIPLPRNNASVLYLYNPNF